MDDGSQQLSNILSRDDLRTSVGHLERGTDGDGGRAGSSSSGVMDRPDQLSPPAMLIDKSQTIIAATPDVATLLGRELEEIVGSTCDQVLNARFAAGAPVCQANCSSTLCLAEGKSYSVDDCWVSRKDGSTIRVAISTRAIRGGPRDKRSPLGLITLARLEPEGDDRDRPAPSEAQAAIIRLLATGYSIKAIAGQLGLSPKTVEYHRTKITTKLGLTDRVQIVEYALRRGWIRGQDTLPTPNPEETAQRLVRRP